MQAQARELSRRPHVVIATPGRLRVCASMTTIFTAVRRFSYACVQQWQSVDCPQAQAQELTVPALPLVVEWLDSCLWYLLPSGAP
jgi:hypothetical protein